MPRLAAAFGRRLPLLLILLSIAALLPLLYIGIYNHPCAADDFQNARWDDCLGFQRSLYLHWSGRYFNNLAATLCPLHWHSFLLYRMAVIGMMAAFCFAFALLIAKGLRRIAGVAAQPAWAVGAVSTVLLLNNFSSLAEGFFWFTGAVTYVLPATAVLCLFSILLNVACRERLRWISTLLAFVLATAAIGGNESMLLLCCAVAACGWLYYRKSDRRPQARFYGKLLTVCIVCAGIAILAPGNFARQAVLPRNVWMVPPTWIYHSLRSFLNWIADPFLVLWSCMIIILLWPLSCRAPRLTLWIAFILPPALILLLSLPAHYALGAAPPPRVMNMLYTFFLVGWVFFLLCLLPRLRQLTSILNEKGLNVVPPAAALAMLYVLLASFNMTALRRSNFFTVAKAFARHIPQAYDAEMNARYNRILNSPGDTVGVAPVRFQVGNVLYTGDIIALKRANTNRHYANYFGKKVVFIDSALIR